MQEIDISEDASPKLAVIISKNQNDLQTSLDVLNVFLAEYDKKLNIKKSKVIIRADNDKKVAIQIENTSIYPIHAIQHIQYNYLGPTIETCRR